MSPPTTLRPPSGAHLRPWLRIIRPMHALLFVVVIGALVGLRPVLAKPHFVPHIAFENPTVYDLAIEVTDGGHEGWMAIVTAKRAGATVAQEIYDVGAVWIFRFTSQGETGSELRVARADLERNDWHVAIPAAVGEELRSKGAPVPP